MTLTIITPVFNSISYIEKCILNVIEQNCQDIIHLIIDGGSDDGTKEIIEKYSKEYNHIKWISERDNGQSDAMNKGLKMVRSGYISFLNVDDFYENNLLNKIINIFKQNPNLDFIVGNCNVIDENGELIYINKPRKLKVWHILSGYFLPVNPSAYFYKIELHDNLGEFNINNHYNMDVEFLLNVSYNYNLVYYDELWGNFRILPNTKTGSDQLNNNLENRKNELFKSFSSNLPTRILFLVKFVKISEKSKRIIKRIIKKCYLPIDMIYWKFKKIKSNL